jgi:hypothetical protein
MRLLAGVIFSVWVGVAPQGQSSATASTPKGIAAPAVIKGAITVRGKYVSLVVGSSVTTASPGARLTLLLQVTPGPKIHVYAPGQEGYLPVDLSVIGNAAFSAKAAVYPAPTPYRFAPTAETVKVYAAPFLLRQDIVLASSSALKGRAAKGDSLAVIGAFEYQACDDAVCYRPETLPLEWKIKLVPTAK